MLIVTSYFTGEIAIPNVRENANALNQAIEQYEKEILIQLLGYKLYSLMVADLVNGEPQSQIFIDLVNDAEFTHVIHGESMLMKWSRAKFRTTLASIYETSLVFEHHANTPSVYIMASDQSPSNASKSYWIKFLGRETAFLHGPEKYARMYNYPVMYVDVQRVKRGYYTLEAVLLTDDPASLPEGELTLMYSEKLGESIRKNPGSWLWSHKRWKLTR